MTFEERSQSKITLKIFMLKHNKVFRIDKVCLACMVEVLAEEKIFLFLFSI